jgi:hypothetical protein
LEDGDKKLKRVNTAKDRNTEKRKVQNVIEGKYSAKREKSAQRIRDSK